MTPPQCHCFFFKPFFRLLLFFWGSFSSILRPCTLQSKATRGRQLLLNGMPPPPIRFYYEVLPPFFSFLACCLPFCSRNNCQWQLLRTCKLGCSRKTERRTAALYWPKTTRPSLWLIRWTEGYLYGTNTYTYKHKRIHY